LSDLSPLQLTLTAATNLRQTGPMQLRLLLMQHFHAGAAENFQWCSEVPRPHLHSQTIFH
jgi:hypothetical protein